MSSFAMCNSLQAFKTEMFLEFDISILWHMAQLHKPLMWKKTVFLAPLRHTICFNWYY